MEAARVIRKTTIYLDGSYVNTNADGSTTRYPADTSSGVQVKRESMSPDLWKAKSHHSMTPFAKTPIIGCSDSDSGTHWQSSLHPSLSSWSFESEEILSLPPRAPTPLGHPWNYTPQPEVLAEDESQDNACDDDDSSEYAVECMLDTSSSGPSSAHPSYSANETGPTDISIKSESVDISYGVVLTSSYRARLEIERMMAKTQTRKDCVG